MSENKKTKVVIAGGGTAGWLSAFSLATRLGNLLDITLVESDQIGTVGVGEATIPTMRSFHQLMGINEQEFMSATQATFKLGIQFENWGCKDENYLHSFGEIGQRAWMAEFHAFWMAAKESGYSAGLDDFCLELKAAREGKFALAAGKKPLNYAFHLDATAYAAWLRKKSEAAGVKRIEGKIAAVDLHSDSGNITALKLESGQVIAGDVFIDCTGFRGLLIGEYLGVEYEDWSHYLAADSAIAVQTESVEPPLPYTRAIARDAGWQWDINLQTRRGLGYVYSSAFLSDDEAEAQLRAFEGPHTKNIPVNRIKFASTKRHVSWKKNCVAIGLSDGFLEPLESSGLYMIEYGAQMLGLMLQDFAHAPDATIRNFNRNMDDLYDEVLSFINLHYVISNRRDTPFWRAATADSAIWSGLRDKLEIWQNRPPHDMDMHGPQRLFALDSFEFILHGMKYVAPDHGLTPTMPDHTEILKKCRTHLPKHEVFLDLLARASKAMA